MGSRALFKIVGRTDRNAWPGGSRRIPCLRCSKKFLSAGRSQRICPRCREENRRDALGALAVGYMR